jgi:hypothetical protein
MVNTKMETLSSSHTPAEHSFEWSIHDPSDPYTRRSSSPFFSPDGGALMLKTETEVLYAWETENWTPLPLPDTLPELTKEVEHALTFRRLLMDQPAPLQNGLTIVAKKKRDYRTIAFTIQQQESAVATHEVDDADPSSVYTGAWVSNDHQNIMIETEKLQRINKIELINVQSPNIILTLVSHYGSDSECSVWFSPDDRFVCALTQNYRRHQVVHHIVVRKTQDLLANMVKAQAEIIKQREALKAIEELTATLAGEEQRRISLEKIRIAGKRREQGLCVSCGRPLGLWDRLRSLENHRGCN